MSLKVALVGNPNSGKTTLFNALTGSNQYVGNWPGVTVEKKEGLLKEFRDVTLVDLPGIYSLSPYTLEEVVARDYLVKERPDAILNVVDGTNLERNLYLTTQLLESGIPVVIVINMFDVMKKNGDCLRICELAESLGCRILKISALKSEGVTEAAEAAVQAAKGSSSIVGHRFCGVVEHVLAHIEEATLRNMDPSRQRWFAIKIFERDEKVIESLGISEDIMMKIESDIREAEKECDDDSESIITNERYEYITQILKNTYTKNSKRGLSRSERIDQIVTNRFAAIPIFIAVMFFVYFISVSTVGAWATDWANEGVFGDGWDLFGSIYVPGIPVLVEAALEAVGCAQWLQGLIIDGIIGGVGSVLGFVPQMIVLFLCLAFLESCGYMTRIAFIMDRIFRKFGLSGKSFIPMLVGTGCGVPGIMASRTIENEKDRRMTIITTTFIPCGAKLPIIALVAGAMFGGAWWVAPSAYFIGIGAILASGIFLKKTRLFNGEPTPFVMELPAYHMPTVKGLFMSMWERSWSFVKKAGTVILLASVCVWFASNFGWDEAGFGMVDMDNSVLARLGSYISIIFAPLGWGNWQGAVATLTGLIAKENVVSTFGVLFDGLEEVSENGVEIWNSMADVFTPLAAYSFLVFNLLCAPCFAAMGAIRREMNSARWTAFAIAYQCGFAYITALVIYQVGSVLIGQRNRVGTIAVFLIVCGIIGWIILNMVRNKKAGKTSCGCECKGCSMKDQCHH